jgi:hypothetical protein
VERREFIMLSQPLLQFYCTPVVEKTAMLIKFIFSTGRISRIE